MLADVAKLLKTCLLDAFGGHLAAESYGSAAHQSFTLLCNLLVSRKCGSSLRHDCYQKEWRPVVDVLLCWAPKAIMDRLNQLSPLAPGPSKRKLLLSVCDMATGEPGTTGCFSPIKITMVGAIRGPWLGVPC